MFQAVPGQVTVGRLMAGNLAYIHGGTVSVKPVNTLIAKADQFVRVQYALLKLLE